MKKKNSEKIPKLKLRKHLNADALIETIKQGFEEIPDHRKGNVKISLADSLMSAFAMFSIKEPSLLSFDKKVKSENHNLNSIYNIGTIPCDTRMRENLDEVLPESVVPGFKLSIKLARGYHLSL